ncbi:eukaryotic translation initiation factor 5 [Neurospora tetrasperma FGSC 2508]|uniref:Eukaryotic translation initiation factor 5 n=1 Tax=Neurospora tetrasperma (strain FGSC 2508 / ATCC MYA-4615 / P0657) TaxID=510951 RepID=F8MNA0_NEUT8|nr:eukaryotic translation initiation factor 5 [Neurospora tetrasperma FGSC 2508]EGO58070.1 eukaryotic translation initiation factor 5 [Neurospora tetrasperma FGSC 2508]EGZ71621.1 eukaryotic translation initiation factor 5 [Neurospora tetrasperma FGSC 2509]
MGALINVRRDNPDPFYRYKMERIQTKIEGKGNGIKTVVVNLSSVAQSLARPGGYLIKYFGFELGAQTNIDPPDDRWIINGSHEAAKLQDLLDGFISKFVLCKKCKNPETVVQIKDEKITLDCKACGQRSKVEPQLKLTSFILKNASPAIEDKNIEYASDDDELTRKIKSEAQSLQLDKRNAPKEEEWAVDMSEEAVRARQQNLPGEFKQKLVLNGEEDEEEEGGNTVYDQLGTWIEDEAKAKGGINHVDDVEIYLKAKELGIDAKHRTVQVLVQCLFDENIVAQIPKRAPMLKRLVTSERHEKALLGGTERLLADLGKESYDKIVKILQLYYHHDLCSEEVITKWGSKASKKYVDGSTSKKIRKAAEPFLTWLAEAESEEEESEEEDDE